MAKSPTQKTYTAREIGAAINNSLLAASQPEDFVILESRLRKLSEYAAAVVEPCSKHLEQFKASGEPLITHQELVLALLSAALLVFSQNNVGGDKLPLVSLAKIIQKGQK